MQRSVRMVGSAEADDLDFGPRRVAIDRRGGFDAGMPGPCLPRLVISGALEGLRLCSALHEPPPSGFDLQSACANALNFGGPLEPAPANERRILVYIHAM